MMVDSMRAATYDRYGPPEVLHVSRMPRPTPGPGEVLVKVDASSVNGGEVIGRQGRLKAITGRVFPKRIGIDFVGFVAQLGADVTQSLMGVRVWGAVDERGGLGAAAEFVIAPAGNLSPAPAGLSSADAASLLSGGSTALAALRDKAQLSRGERLLVRGASGGVGSVAVQVGKMLGAHVTALANTGSTEFVLGLGADELIDYRTPARELGTFDVIFDTRGTQLRAFRSRLAPHGRMVTIAFDIDHIARSLGYILFSAIHGNGRVRLFLGHPDGARFTELADAVERGELRPVVDRTYPLEQIAAAHASLEAGRIHGKIIIDIASPSSLE